MMIIHDDITNMKIKRLLFWTGGIMLALLLTAGMTILRTVGRTLIQVNIHQNEEAIYYSSFAEPPQFAIWLENKETHKCQTIFVTRRAGIGDWEGKSNVPVALPRWFELFKDKETYPDQSVKKDDDLISAITGATPKDDYFSVRAEVKPGSQWLCWIEMNLAGDYNEAYPEKNLKTFEVDEYGNGQPALLYRSDISVEEGLKFDFNLFAQSVWADGEISIQPVGEGITSAKHVFEELNIEVIRPKPKLIEKYKIGNVQGQ